MPTYEYRCSSCSHRFDLRQGFDDPPVAQCPQCEGSAQRMISRVGVVFKGSGWYSTDHRDSRSTTSSDGAAPEAADSAGSETNDSGGDAQERETTTAPTTES